MSCRFAAFYRVVKWIVNELVKSAHVVTISRKGLVKSASAGYVFTAPRNVICARMIMGFKRLIRTTALLVHYTHVHLFSHVLLLSFCTFTENIILITDMNGLNTIFFFKSKLNLDPEFIIMRYLTKGLVFSCTKRKETNNIVCPLSRCFLTIQ